MSKLKSPSSGLRPPGSGLMKPSKGLAKPTKVAKALEPAASADKKKKTPEFGPRKTPEPTNSIGKKMKSPMDRTPSKLAISGPKLGAQGGAHTPKPKLQFAPKRRTASFSQPISPLAPKRKRAALSESITVVVRVKPFLEGESKEAKNRPALSVTGDVISIDGGNPANRGTFAYDRVYGPETTQDQLHDDCTSLLVSQVMDGFNGTALVYGQTGSGKTHTMMGEVEDEEMAGVIPRSIKQVFTHADLAEYDKFVVHVSLLEVYNENVYDLLAGTESPMEVRENPDGTFFVEGLQQLEISNPEEGIEAVLRGNEHRAVSENNMHKDSSRSHCMLTLSVTKTLSIGGRVQTTTSKLNLVDLAGSERYQETGGKLAKESVNINQSLSCLANVISALTSGGKTNARHIPYRDSKLTRLLKDSLGGNCKTLMISNLHQSFSCLRETLGTLRYASRAKKIKNNARINADDVDDRVQVLLDEVAALKDMIIKKDNFARHVLSLFHETLQVKGVSDQEMRWERATIEQLYAKGKAALIQSDVLEEFRGDISILMEMRLSLLETQTAAETANKELEEVMQENQLLAEESEMMVYQLETAQEEIGMQVDLLNKTKEVVIMEGFLMKKSSGLIKRWQKRHVRLTNKQFSYSNGKIREANLHFNGMIVSEGESDDPLKATIVIQTDERHYFFMPCESDNKEDSSATWIEAIKQAIIDFHITFVTVKRTTENPEKRMTKIFARE